VAATVEEPREHGRRLARSTALFSLATGLSRVLGLVREMVAANYFGAAGRVNAFTVAFQVPNLVRALVADAALSGAFVPVFSELLEKGEAKRAWRVASSLFWLMLLGLSGLTALFIVIAPWILGIFGDPGGDRELAIGLARVLFPIVVMLGISGIVVGILTSYEQFTIPALAPVFWNLAIIAGLALGIPHADTESKKLYVYAIAIVIGTLVQVLLPMPWLRGRDDRLRMVVDWRDPAVRQIFKLMIPVTVGLGLINFNAVVDSAFASRLIDPNLSPTAIEKAFRIYMLPQGMFAVAIATVLFPSLSRLAARGDMDGFRSTVNGGLRQIAFLLIPAGVVTAVLAQPVTRIIYQRGAWGSHETAVTAGAVAAVCGGLVFNGWMLMLNRSFFSLQENWTPTLVAGGNLVLNAGLDAIFYRFGTWGIPLSTTLVNMAGSMVLLTLLQRRVGRLQVGSTLPALTRVGLAAALAGLSWFVWRALDEVLGRSLEGQLGSLIPALLVAAGLYLGACRLLGVREFDAVLALRHRGRSAPPPEIPS
jgi:putative peptidoglycan lipid II flippase